MKIILSNNIRHTAGKFDVLQIIVGIFYIEFRGTRQDKQQILKFA